MKRFILLAGLCLLVLFKSAATQEEKERHDRWQIQEILSQFQRSIKDKQKEPFLALFLHDSIPWVGVSDAATLAFSRQQYPALPAVQNGSCRGFIDFICGYKGEIEEKFFNTHMQLDGHLAVVVFDYSYWRDGRPQNWGKESWNLLKVNGAWKIAAVYYSGTLHQVIPTPKQLL